MTNKRPKVWIGVISRAHVERGVAGGFTQVCHGRRAPLARMHPGDWFIAYSPTTELGGGVRLQAFTALGLVRDDVITQVDLGGGFRPFRRAIDWLPVRPVELEAVRASLAFVRDGGWGLKARRGHFEVSSDDGLVLRHAMLGRSPSAGADASTP